MFCYGHPKWDKQIRENRQKLNKLGNTVLHQMGKLMEREDKMYLLETCALDLYGIEFCKGMTKKVWTDLERSYHWLVKRGLREGKNYGNHKACAEAGMLTWNLLVNWKKAILWDLLRNSNNKIVEVFYGKNKWETEFGGEMRSLYMEHGKDCNGAREIKKRMKLFVEAMAVLKEEEALSV